MKILNKNVETRFIVSNRKDVINYISTKRKSAFTIVELIVVITILAILATIAFLSFQNISSSARDSSRLSDVASIKKVLELGNATNGGFPMPDSYNGITYSGRVAWYQGTMGDTAVQQLKKLSKAPIDPLLKSPYTYSVTNSLKEYQIGYALENSVSMKNLLNNPPVLADIPLNKGDQSGIFTPPYQGGKRETSGGINKTFADTSSLLGYTDGNYNGLMIKVSTGALDYYLAVPSIISADTTKTNLVNQTGSLVFNGKKSLPSNTATAFFGTNKTDTGLVFNPSSFVIYSGTAGTSPDTTLFMSGLKNVYTGSTMTNLSDTNLTNSVNTLLNNTNSLASVLGKVGTAVNVSSTNITNNGVNLTISSSGNNINIANLVLLSNASLNSKVIVTINTGVIIGSNGTNIPALTTVPLNGSWPNNTTITIINNGKILGAGGYGSAGQRGSCNTPDTVSLDGGNAIELTNGISYIITNNGDIRGGGGGGGHWGRASGGGGAGYIVGVSRQSRCNNSVANNGTITSGGVGIAYSPPGSCAQGGNSGFSGNGGNSGLPGGNTTTDLGCGTFTVTGGAGGYAIVKNGASVTYNNSTLNTNLNYSGWITGTYGRIAQ